MRECLPAPYQGTRALPPRPHWGSPKTPLGVFWTPLSKPHLKKQSIFTPAKYRV